MNFNSPILTLKYYKQPTYTHNTTTIVPNPRKHILHETAILTGMNFNSPILTLCAQVNLTPTIQQFNILPNPRKTCDMKHVKQQSWQGWILALHFWLRSSIPNSVLGQHPQVNNSIFYQIRGNTNVALNTWNTLINTSNRSNTTMGWVWVGGGVGGGMWWGQTAVNWTTHGKLSEHWEGKSPTHTASWQHCRLSISSHFGWVWQILTNMRRAGLSHAGRCKIQRLF